MDDIAITPIAVTLYEIFILLYKILPSGKVSSSSLLKILVTSIHIVYTITVKMIVNIMAIFWIIIPLSVLYISKANIPIVTVANIGFSTNFVNSKFNINNSVN